MKFSAVALLALAVVDGFTIPNKLHSRRKALKLFNNDEEKNSKLPKSRKDEKDSEKEGGPFPLFGAVGGLGVGTLAGFALDTQLPMEALVGSEFVAPAVLGTLLAGGAFAVLSGGKKKEATSSTQVDGINGESRVNGEARGKSENGFTNGSFSNRPGGNDDAAVRAEIERKTSELEAIVAKRKALEQQMIQAQRLQEQKVRAGTGGDMDSYRAYEETQRRDKKDTKVLSEIERKTVDLKNLEAKRKYLKEQMDQAKDLELKKIAALRKAEREQKIQSVEKERMSQATNRERMRQPTSPVPLNSSTERRTPLIPPSSTDQRGTPPPAASGQKVEEKKDKEPMNRFQKAAKKAAEWTAQRTAPKNPQQEVDRTAQTTGSMMTRPSTDAIAPPDRRQANNGRMAPIPGQTSAMGQVPLDRAAQMNMEQDAQMRAQRQAEREKEAESRRQRKEAIEMRLQALEQLISQLDFAEEEAKRIQAEKLRQSAIEQARAAAEAKRRSEEREKARKEEAARALRESQERAARERQMAVEAKAEAVRRAEAERKAQQFRSVEARRIELEKQTRNGPQDPTQRTKNEQVSPARPVDRTKPAVIKSWQTKPTTSQQQPPREGTRQTPPAVPSAPLGSPQGESLADLRARQAKAASGKFAAPTRQGPVVDEEARRSQLRAQNAQEVQARQRAIEEQRARAERAKQKSQEELRAEAIRASDARRRILMEEKMKAEQAKRQAEEELRVKSAQAAEARRIAVEVQRRKAEDMEYARIEAQDEARIAQLEKLLEIAETRLYERLSRQPREVIDRITGGDPQKRQMLEQILATAPRSR
eukprot:CAMPEP_0202450470 /NCGR_PEP_ID=MMETSP1360-20130828/9069_1 /ASSEMBLY_ACC=CAM_ASM_000848 /TAXON_ID=515479 /ORGANISM="Licmophora paradoxa, Strain CCMP2313" /LENGTH=818 /DNA_ID=CAMNT_0049068751 /DNA_START=36 /DNA_END=2492 /DNA_ORIENTATION=-